MTTIKTTCSNCGDIELTAGDVRMCLPTRHSTEGRYEATCNLCNREVRRPANKRVVSILMAVGVEIVYDSEPISEEYIAKEVEALAAELEANSCLVEVLEKESKSS